MVVGVDEVVDLGLQCGDGVGGGSGAQPAFHGLLEALDLAAGGREVGSAVLLGDAESGQFVLEAVAGGAAAVREAGREHQTVVSHRRRGDSVVFDRGSEGVDDDRSSDDTVGGDRQGVAGVIVEPGEDLGVGAVGEAMVGDVGLPGLVGLFGCEPDVGGPRLLLRRRLDQGVAFAWKARVQATATTNISMLYIFSAMPIGAVLMLLVAVELVLRGFLGLFDPEAGVHQTSLDMAESGE